MSSHKALNMPIGDIMTFHAWHDIELMESSNGEPVLRPHGCDPIRNYIEELDEILITGKVSDFDVLRGLRKDLDEIHRKFVQLKFEGWYESEKGGAQ